MAKAESLAPRLTPLAALMISLMFGAIIVTLDIMTGADMNLAIFKTVVLMVAAATRNWKFLWAMTAVLIITTFTVMITVTTTTPRMTNTVVTNTTFMRLHTVMSRTPTRTCRILLLTTNTMLNQLLTLRTCA